VVFVNQSAEAFKTRDKSQLALFRWIEGSLQQPRHSALGQPSPQKYEEVTMREDLQTAVAV
jgi:hypothetical protein